MALVECKVCGEKISDKASACPHCGSVLIENNRGKNNLNLCEECKTEVPADAKVCPACGCPVNVINETISDDNSKKQKSIVKKWWFWCLLIFVVFFVFMISGDDEASETADSVETNIESDSEVEETTLTSEIESQITAVDFYKWIDENDTSMEYSVPEKAIAFMEEHPEFFPGNENNTGAMSDYVDYEVTYQHITKSPSKYNDKLISINGTVIDCYEEECEYGTLTFVQVVDDYTGSSYCLYYWGSLENVFEKNWVWGYALPFDVTTFDNMGGYHTEAVVGAACYIMNTAAEDEYNGL